MKSLWEKGQFPMLSPSLPALNKHTEQVRSRLTIDMFCSWTLITNNDTLQRGWNHPTFSGCSNETQGSLKWFEQRWPCTDQQGHKIPAEVRDTPALLQNGSVSHYWDTGPGLAHLTQWLFHAHSSLLWRRYSSTTERASWTPVPNAPALPLPSWTEPVFQSKRKLLRRLRLSSPLTFSFVGMHKQERWRWEQDQKEWRVYYELTAGTHHNDNRAKCWEDLATQLILSFYFSESRAASFQVQIIFSICVEPSRTMTDRSWGYVSRAELCWAVLLSTTEKNIHLYT